MKARGRATSAHPVTDEDRARLKAYASKLDDATELIRAEIESIKSGRMSAVSETYPAKAEVLKWLELRAPVIEPFLGLECAEDYHFQTRLAALKHVLDQDEKMLKHLAQVAAAVSREIEKVIHRDSLDGLYGQSGKKLSALSAPQKSLDQEI